MRATAEAELSKEDWIALKALLDRMRDVLRAWMPVQERARAQRGLCAGARGYIGGSQTLEANSPAVQRLEDAFRSAMATQRAEADTAAAEVRTK